MNPNIFTQKSLEAVSAAQTIALSAQNMQIEEIHLLLALLEQEDGLIPQIITKMGKDPTAFEKAAQSEAAKIPGVSGPGREAGKIYVSADVDLVLNDAEKIAKSMTDEYVSVEHLFLALIDRAD